MTSLGMFSLPFRLKESFAMLVMLQWAGTFSTGEVNSPNSVISTVSCSKNTYRSYYIRTQQADCWDELFLRVELLEIYGPNVTTTEGKTFQFHVRIVAPPFADNTGANGLVWNETRSQTNRLVSSWSCESPSSVQSDVNGLTLAVIAKAGFGQELEWKSESGNSETALPAGHSLTFLEAMTKTMIYMIPVLLMPRWLMRITPLRHAAIAHGEFEHYVREMIRMEKYRISKSGNNESTAIRGNLLTSVLQASADHASAAEKSNDFATRKQSFTEDEVMGNLFLYLLAGYETTANSILYGLICLALYPDMQEHVIGELDRVHREAADQGRSDLTYSDDFSKLEYTYGFMVSKAESPSRPFLHSLLQWSSLTPSRHPSTKPSGSSPPHNKLPKWFPRPPRSPSPRPPAHSSTAFPLAAVSISTYPQRTTPSVTGPIPISSIQNVGSIATPPRPMPVENDYSRRIGTAIQRAPFSLSRGAHEPAWDENSLKVNLWRLS